MKINWCLFFSIFKCHILDKEINGVRFIFDSFMDSVFADGFDNRLQSRF